MSEPKPAYFTQCPASMYSFGERRHCTHPAGHDGLHYHPDGGWMATPLEWDEVGNLPEPKRPIAYLAGPMTGKKDWNFPAFNKAADKLRSSGWEVINPAEEFKGATDLPREVYMEKAMKNVLRADTIFTLRGWKNSEGATLEVMVAQAIGKEVKGIA